MTPLAQDLRIGNLVLLRPSGDRPLTNRLGELVARNAQPAGALALVGSARCTPQAQQILELAVAAESMAPTADLAVVGPAPGLTRWHDELRDAFIQAGRVAELAEHPAVRHHLLADVSALILAAGEGRRARPLSARLAKPLFPVLDQPALVHLARHLAGYGARHLWLNAAHLWWQIERCARNLSAQGIPTSVLREGRHSNAAFEAAPAGSASTLRRLRQEGALCGQDVVVLCGDAVTDIDLGLMRLTHLLSGSDVTVAVREVPAALQSRYGIAETDPTGRICAFHEKPSPGRTSSRLASLGIYIFSAAAVDEIARRAWRDLGREALPGLIAAGARVEAHRTSRSWQDLGTCADLLAANLEAVRRQGSAPTGYEAAAPHARIDGPVFLGRGTRIGRGAWINGPAVIGAGASIGAGATIQDSLVLPGARVPEHAVLSGVIVDPDLGIIRTGRSRRTPEAEAA